jgi:hypothetical protein
MKCKPSYELQLSENSFVWTAFVLPSLLISRYEKK